jgi:hypothetical protein
MKRLKNSVMIVNQKALIKRNYWLTIIAITTIVSLTNCNCGKGGIEDPFITEQWKTLNSNTKGAIQTPEDEDTEEKELEKERQKERELDKIVTPLFESIESSPPQSAEKKEADKKAIQQTIGNLSGDEKIMLKYYAAAVDMEQDAFTDLFASLTDGIKIFKIMFPGHTKADLLALSEKGISPSSLEDAMIKKKNDTLSRQELAHFLYNKGKIQRIYINNLKKAAAAQAKNN